MILGSVYVGRLVCFFLQLRTSNSVKSRHYPDFDIEEKFSGIQSFPSLPIHCIHCIRFNSVKRHSVPGFACSACPVFSCEWFCAIQSF